MPTFADQMYEIFGSESDSYSDFECNLNSDEDITEYQIYTNITYKTNRKLNLKSELPKRFHQNLKELKAIRNSCIKDAIHNDKFTDVSFSIGVNKDTYKSIKTILAMQSEYFELS